MFEIETGKNPAPLRIGVSGVDGVGKTTLCTQMPSPLFLFFEEGVMSLTYQKSI